MMTDEPNQLDPRSPRESARTTAIDLLALHDETDREAARLRRLPSALGLPGLGLFLALFVFVLAASDLGFLASFGVSLLVASPAVILVVRDFNRTRRLRLLQRMIEVTGDPGRAQDDDVPRLSSDGVALEEGRSPEPG
jgi:hypothetical protein